MDNLSKAVPARPRSPAVTPRQMSMVFDNTELQGLGHYSRRMFFSLMSSQVADALGVAIAMNAGAANVYSLRALEAFKELKAA